MVKRSGGNLVVFDIETGGFKADNNPLVEVCFICYDTITLKEIDRYESLVKPYYEHPITKTALTYEKGAMDTHGISIRQMEDDGKPVQQVVRDISNFLKKNKLPGRFGRPYLGGHNILGFDIPFLSTVASWYNVNWMENIDETILDSLKWGRLIWPQTTQQNSKSKVANHQLGTCCSAVGIKLVDSHRASSDTEANAELFLRWISMMRGGTVKVDGASEIDNKSKPYQF